jgi:hypothetical protein
MDREKTFDELEDGLAIDKFNLDDDIIQQPELYRIVSQRYELEVSKRDAAKQTLTEVEANIDAEIRNDAAKHNERITENDIKSQVAIHREVLAAKQDLHVLSQSVGQLKGLEKAYDHRMKALDLLVRLHGSQYFSTPTKVLGTHKTNQANFVKTEMNRMRREKRITK